MELKVWVEGIQRIVCGVTDATTCQDVVYVLVHATGKAGRFALVEKWRHSERLLPPHERPLRVLSKWGEYAGDVQLVLRRSASETPPEGAARTQQQDFVQTQVGSGGAKSQPSAAPGRDAPIRKSLTFSGGRPSHGGGATTERRDWSEVPRGVVKGVPQRMPAEPNGPSPPKDAVVAEIAANLGDFAPTGQCRGKSGHDANHAPRTPKAPGPCGHLPVHAVRSAEAAVAVGPPMGPRILLPPNVVSSSKPQGGWSPSQEPRPIANGDSPKAAPPPNPNVRSMPLPVSSGDGMGHGARRNEPQNHRGPTMNGDGNGPSPSRAPARSMQNWNGDGMGHEPHPRDGDGIGHVSFAVRRAELPHNHRGQTEQQVTQYGGGSGGMYGNGSVSSINNGESSNSMPNGDGYGHTSQRNEPPQNGDGTRLTPRRIEPQPLNHRTPTEPQGNQYGVTYGSSPSMAPNGTTYGSGGAARTHAAPPGPSSGGKEPLLPNHSTYAPQRTPPSSNPVPIHMGTPKSRRNLLSEFKRHDLEEELREDSFLGHAHQERVVYDARYRELVRLINLQREKLGHQQVDLTQFDAEISYWEEKQKDHQRQIEVIEREIQKSEFCGRDVDEEIAQLDKLHLDDELEIGRQQEKMLQSELTLLRSKLSNCETELLQCKNKIRLLLDDITDDKRRLSKEDEDRKQREVSILNDIEDLQKEIQDVFKGYNSKVNSWEKAEQDVHRLEIAIADKKKQVEGLVREMKEANLESLAFTPAEEIRHLLEGGAPKGPGSSRKIVGSPRQLENAVPTSKNPHGVWV